MESLLEKQKRIEEKKELELLSKIPGMEDEITPEPRGKWRKLTNVEKQDRKRQREDKKKENEKLAEEQRLKRVELQEKLFTEAAASIDVDHETILAYRYKQECEEQAKQKAYEKRQAAARKQEYDEQAKQKAHEKRQAAARKREAKKREAKQAAQQKINSQKQFASQQLTAKQTQQQAEMNERQRQAQIILMQYNRELHEMKTNHKIELEWLRAQYDKKLRELGFMLR